MNDVACHVHLEEGDNQVIFDAKLDCKEACHGQIDIGDEERASKDETDEANQGATRQK